MSINFVMQANPRQNIVYKIKEKLFILIKPELDTFNLDGYETFNNLTTGEENQVRQTGVAIKSADR